LKAELTENNKSYENKTRTAESDGKTVSQSEENKQPHSKNTWITVDKFNMMV